MKKRYNSGIYLTMSHLLPSATGSHYNNCETCLRRLVNSRRAMRAFGKGDFAAVGAVYTCRIFNLTLSNYSAMKWICLKKGVRRWRCLRIPFLRRLTVWLSCYDLCIIQEFGRIVSLYLQAICWVSGRWIVIL